MQLLFVFLFCRTISVLHNDFEARAELANAYGRGVRPLTRSMSGAGALGASRTSVAREVLVATPSLLRDAARETPSILAYQRSLLDALETRVSTAAGAENMSDELKVCMRN